VVLAERVRALPLGTPASALQPKIRFFTLKQVAPGERCHLPTGGRSRSRAVRRSRAGSTSPGRSSDSHVKNLAVVLISDR
jgi:hypothetical protein